MANSFWNSIFRNLWKNRVTSLINLITLTLGLSSCIFLFVYLKYENSFDAHQPKAEQIYRVNITHEYPNRTFRSGNTQSMLAKAMRTEFPDMEAVIQIFGPSDAMVSINPGTSEERVFEEEFNMFFADSIFLKYFDYQFLAGHPRQALDDPNSIILSSELVEKYYPQHVGREHELLGAEINLFDSLRASITGVIKDPPANSNFPFKILASSEYYYRMNNWDRDNWSNISMGLTLAVLQPGENPREIDRRLEDLVNKYREEDAHLVSYSLMNLLEVHRANEWGEFNGNYTVPEAMIVGFTIVGLFILVSACINFINLQTAQSTNRAKEVGIRKVLGGSRGQLIVQFLTETAILTSIAFLVALWIAELALKAWNDLLSIVHTNMQLDLSVFFFGIGLILVVTLISGLYPAFKLSSYKPVEALKSTLLLNVGKRGKLTFRQVLVTIQFVISQILIISTIVIAWQMDYFVSKDLGFKKENVLNVTTYDPDRKKVDRLIQGVESIPEISSFTVTSGPALSNQYNTSFEEIGHEEKGYMETANKFIDHRFISHYDIEIIAGRDFRPDEHNDTIEAFIVNEALVKRLDVSGPEEAIGKQLICYNVKAPIVGVVKDFHHDVLNKKIGPLIMFCRDTHVNEVDVRVAGNNTKQALEKLRELWLEVFPKRTFDFQSLEEAIMEIYIVEDVTFTSIRLFAIIAVIIGCLGLYGLVSFMAIQRIKEIGIRKVLGASYIQILTIFSSKFFVLVGIAFLMAAPVAYIGMDAWLSGYVYRIPLGWQIFATGFGVTLLLTITTIGFISYKAAKTNPAETLQFE